MKPTLALFFTLTFAAAAENEEPAKKPRSSVPAPYPSIIEIGPAGEPGQGIIQSDLGGREMQFFQSATQAGQAQLALSDLAKSKGGSEQIKMIAEMLAGTQATENKEVARLAAAKKFSLAQKPVAADAELAALSGAPFEKVWMERLIAVNEAGLAAYESGAKSADVDVRSFAEKMVPVAKARLQMAQRLGGRPAETKSQPAPIPPPITTPVPAKPARP